MSTVIELDDCKLASSIAMNGAQTIVPTCDDDYKWASCSTAAKCAQLHNCMITTINQGDHSKAMVAIGKQSR